MMPKINQSDPVLSYMDGVQVKIAEAYKPPRKITLPIAYNNNSKLPDITKYCYDVNLEKSVLNKLKDWRMVKLTQHESWQTRMAEKKKKKKEQLNNSPVHSVLSSTVKISIPQTTILIPEPLSLQAKGFHNDDCNVKINGLDYSDFDNDTSSPFDNMELKTINEMEELARVLQPTSAWIPSTRIENILKELNLESKSENHGDEQMNKLNVREDKTDRNISNGQQELNQQNISIIVKELQKELDCLRMKNWKSWTDLESSECDTDPNFNCLNINPSTESTISGFSNEHEKLAEHLSDMGFPLRRVIQAINNLGGEDKKVVEYLLAVQYLEESGISSDDAESALSLNNYDQEKAKKYHENLCTLMNFGFTKDKSSQALLECDNDRDKALDLLCT
ncbi:ubiquitin-associated protein 1 isoform X2 [Chelonus insularis]|nr:ubiquitin-associated protein 1 isoform X2 [Chelonus insularis]XP_034934887.1 ubiquitin-associated protein 1 isoform X2 [Chelonus insularis]XP_034934888.1 ubiquitin-associated protein 1 isoform X2 [Chelonus insularis]XP_034934889.1 ubiquitin-associated protein 1 isoform X2 [Chelonus insularis]